MTAKIDITGHRYGKLVAISKIEPSKRPTWLFKCDCGSTKAIRKYHVTTGATSSCGCIVMTRNGWSGTRLMRVWKSMLRRCYNTKDHRYPRYGGRGISVCPAWMDFDAFKDWALKNGFSELLELDRRDNSSGYSPENCRFVTHKENTRNRDKSATIMIDGKKEHVCEIADRVGISASTIISRIARGDSSERAIRPPRGYIFQGERMSIPAASLKFGISQHIIYHRIKKGLTPDQAVSQKSTN